MLNPHDVLQQYWKFGSFRAGQEEIIHSILAKKDTLAILPTGGGKSICFQVPALCLESICLVVSPLIALMQDQVEQLHSRGITAEALHSGLSKKEQFAILDKSARGELQFLYLSPERLKSELFRERSQYINFSLLAIDEAHCISQWGHDFRPAYLGISEFVNQLPYPIPKIALTASATPEVQSDILQQLHFQEAEIISGSIYRENLQYRVIQTNQKWKEIQFLLSKHIGSCLIYAKTRRTTINIANRLNDLGYQADYYHGGLSPESRTRKQRSWIQNHTRIMVCTNAFGMGVDKADCRLVIHAEIPECLENYYQEAGRAGRDGQAAFPVLMYSDNDYSSFKKNTVQAPSIQVLQNTYTKICSYFQVAPSHASGFVSTVQISELSSFLSIQVNECHNQLEWLRTLGAIQYNPSAFYPASLWIKVSSKQLYDAFLRRKNYEIDIINKILRIYGGVTQLPTRINISEVAKQLQFKEETILSTLQSFHDSGLVQFQESIQASEVELLQNLSGKQINLDLKKYQFLIERSEYRKKSILNYLSSTSCRTQFIASYFGEEINSCGNCDICLLNSEKKQKHDITELLEFLHEARTLSQIQLNFDSTQEEILLQLQNLEMKQLIQVHLIGTNFTYQKK